MKYVKLKRYALTANLKYLSDTPCGCSGMYFKLGHGVGVKVYYDSHKTPEKVFASDCWWQAAHALHALRLVEKSGVAPKPYCLAPVKVDGKYHVGLFMEHIEGVSKHPQKMANAAYRKLAKYGVHHHDRGEHNAILTKDGKLKIIDFDYVEVRK